MSFETSTYYRRK